MVLSGFRCVHPEDQTKIFDFYILWIKTNVAYTRLEMIARTKYCTTTTASNWFVTLYCKLLPAVRSPSKHGRWRSSLLLYSISMQQTYNISYIKTWTFILKQTKWLLFKQLGLYAPKRNTGSKVRPGPSEIYFCQT